MNARFAALALGIAASAAALPEHAALAAGTDRPIFVTVEGHGAIRFRLALGATAPCDSSNNRMLYDGWLAPGRYTWSTGADVVCFQSTFGALRESNWSESRVVPTVRGPRRHPRPMELAVSTD